MSFLDLFSNHAQLYASARPQYPSELYAFLASLCPERKRVWDCGAGNGQASLGLAEFFEEVWATDPSESQIAHALPHPKVSYSVQPAEKTEFADQSFDAICVAQAVHWFRHDEFFAECQRVAKPGCLLAAWGYDWFLVSPEFDEAFLHLARQPIEKEWAPQVVHLHAGYRTLTPPIEAVEAPGFEIACDWTFGQLMAYVTSWSGVQKKLGSDGAEWLEAAASELLQCWGDRGEVKRVLMPLHLMVGRVLA